MAVLICVTLVIITNHCEPYAYTIKILINLQSQIKQVLVTLKKWFSVYIYSYIFFGHPESSKRAGMCRVSEFTEGGDQGYSTKKKQILYSYCGRSVLFEEWIN